MHAPMKNDGISQIHGSKGSLKVTVSKVPPFKPALPVCQEQRRGVSAAP
jgi:hypothetical protein